MIDGFKSLKKEFIGDSAVIAEIDGEIECACAWINDTETEDEEPKDRRSLRELRDSSSLEQPREQERSIFDDVDE